eukprot:TRINITY_DN41265_c0_g1_i1.p1 TRINITY_DN41265_c0_g1~~TRINITY_DN41265_c0_g1_i1.p1  ORF type:complete len:106 (-),score=18.93 TRINITY_DN41265_c0_g1_i1:642-959(-)
MILVSVPSELASHVLSVQQEAHNSQFLINLSSKFKSVTAALMNREMRTDLDACVQEVLREKFDSNPSLSSMLHQGLLQLSNMRKLLSWLQKGRRFNSFSAKVVVI